MKRSMLAIVQCTNCGEATMKQIQDLNKSITLYDADGKVIREWKTKSEVEDKGGEVYFLDANNKAIMITDKFIVEEW